MSKVLANLLGEPEETVVKAIKELEALNGHPSHDVRLLSENAQTLRQKTSQLQLDPDDTMAEELYHGLLAKYERDSQQLDHALGISAEDDFSARAAKAGQLVTSAVDLPEHWALKQTALRQILRAHPPLKTIKKLHYRSFESLLRRQDLSVVLMTASYLESGAWRKAVAKVINTAKSTNFEMRRVKIIALPDILTQSKGPENNVATSEATAALGLWPSQKLDHALCLTLAALLLNGLEQLNCHFSLTELAKINPALKWWSTNGHLISSHDNHTVSLNLRDTAVNHLGQTDFGRHTNAAAQKNLWQKLLDSYDQHPNFLDNLFGAESLPEIKLPLAQLAPEYIEI